MLNIEIVKLCSQELLCFVTFSAQVNTEAESRLKKRVKVKSAIRAHRCAPTPYQDRHGSLEEVAQTAGLVVRCCVC